MTQLSQAANKWSSIPQIDEAEGEQVPRVQVSVKLTAFYSQFDPLDVKGSQQKVSDRIRTLLRRAKAIAIADTLVLRDAGSLWYGRPNS